MIVRNPDGSRRVVKAVMNTFRIDEVSPVDKAAQAGATIAFIKRAPGNDDTDDEKTTPPKPGKGAKETDMADTNDTITEALKGQLAKAQADVVRLTATLAESDAWGKLTDAHKAHAKSLDADARAVFVAKSAPERAIELAKALEADPVLHTTSDGHEIRKSAGDLVLAMAKKLDAQAVELAKAAEATTVATFVKQAETDIPALPGTVVQKAAVLRAVAGLPEETAKAALAMLKSANAAQAGAFARNGTRTPALLEKTEGDGTGTDELGRAGGGAEAQLDGLAKAYMKENPEVSFAKATAHVADTAAGKALYADMDRLNKRSID